MTHPQLENVEGAIRGVKELVAMLADTQERLRSSIAERRALTQELLACRLALAAARPAETGFNAFVLAGAWQLFCENLALVRRSAER